MPPTFSSIKSYFQKAIGSSTSASPKVLGTRTANAMMFLRPDSIVRPRLFTDTDGRYINWRTLYLIAYGGDPYVYRAIRMKGEAVGGIDWRLFDSNDKEIDKHPLLDLIRKPNPFQGQSQFFQAWVSYLDITGNNFTESVGPDDEGKEPPQELYNIRPDQMAVRVGDRYQPIRHYIFNNTLEIPTEAILHTKYFKPNLEDDNFGQSPLAACWDAIQQNHLAKQSNIGLLENSCIPSLFVNFPEEISEDQFEKATNKIRDAYAGSARSGT
ncbi:MAG: phage portal protein, partial [Candidatus Methanoperedens sp.]